MRLADAVDSFVDAIDGELAPSTIQWYQSHLSHLSAHLGNLDINDITPQDLRAWRADRFHDETRYTEHPIRPTEEGPISDATAHGAIRALKRLFHWLHEEDLIEGNPADRLKLPPQPRNREPKAISEREIRALFDAADNDRDRAIICVLADTGARVAGVANLTLDDIQLSKGILVVTEKGNKSREVYLTRQGLEALQAYVKVRRANPGCDALFVSLHRGTPLTVGGIYQMLRRLAERAGVERFNPHSFRHAFVKALLEAGESLDAVADLAGHSSVAVTSESYAIWTKAELRHKHGRASRRRALWDKSFDDPEPQPESNSQPDRQPRPQPEPTGAPKPAPKPSSGAASDPTSEPETRREHLPDPFADPIDDLLATLASTERPKRPH